jgi:hypothetical protein
MTYKAKGKTFLTDHPEEFGSVSWNVLVKEGFMYDGKAIRSKLRLSDCYKSIELDFFCKNQKGLTKRLEKIDTLINELLNMSQALREAGELIKPAKVY